MTRSILSSEDKTGCRTGAYGSGRYVVRADIPESSRIAAFIRQGDFLRLDACHRLPTRNRQHRVYSFYMPAIDRDVIMKVHWIDPSYPWLRRMEIRLSRCFKNRCKRSFQGAMALRRAGVRTLNPLAYWSCDTTPRGAEHYLLYEKIPAKFSVYDYRCQVKANLTLAGRKRLDCLIEALADLAARIHASNLRHGDLAFGNVLMDLNGEPPEWHRGHLPPHPPLYVIDTDQVRCSRAWNPFIKRVLDIKSLKPVHLDSHEQGVFFRRYLGKADVAFWIRVFVFWKEGRYRLIHRMRRWWRQRKRG